MIKQMRHKVAMATKCAKNEHSFIVSGWKKSPQKDSAYQYTCSCCLTTVNQTEYEIVRDHLDKCCREKFEAEEVKE